jgi:hypothetical protein
MISTAHLYFGHPSLERRGVVRLQFLMKSTLTRSAVEVLRPGLDRMLVKPPQYCCLRRARSFRPGVNGFLQRR